MRKRGFLASSFEMPNEFNCSSIRIDEERQGCKNPQNNHFLAAPKNNMFKQFEQNSLYGLQGSSLSISANKDQMFELMRSKSGPLLPNSGRVEHSARGNTSQNENGASLYNTSSFDEMTMKMTIKQNTSNLSNFSHKSQLNSGRPQKHLRKPEQMKKFKATYADSDMKEIISNERRIHKRNNTISILEQDQGQTTEERLERNKKVTDFIKRQTLLDNLECSNVDSEPSRNFEEECSYQEPYFRKPSERIQEQQDIEVHILKASLERKPKLKVQTGKNEENKFSLAPSSQNKKITLRDYLNLNSLMGKVKEPEVTTPVSVHSKISRVTDVPSSPRSVRSSSRRKCQTSKTELLQTIMLELKRDIRHIQENLEMILQNCDGEDKYFEEPNESQILNAYNMSRIVKEKLLQGSNEVMISMKKSNRSEKKYSS